MKSVNIVFVVVVVMAVLWSLGQSQTVPYVSFMGQTLANHSYVDLSLVGTDSDSVQCHTDLITCCSAAQGFHRGDWYFPNGDRLPFPGGDAIILEVRGAQRVDLRRKSHSSHGTGIYRCDISTDTVHHSTDMSVRDMVYVGLYQFHQGSLTVKFIHGALSTAALFQEISQ